MSYVVNESCIRCKTMDCVDVCPVDCFYEGGQTILNVIGDLLADGCQVLRYAMEYKPVAELLAAFV